MSLSTPRRSPGRSPGRRSGASWWVHAALSAWLLLAALPVAWTAVISLRHYVDAFSSPLKWLAPVTLDNYLRLWVELFRLIPATGYRI